MTNIIIQTALIFAGLGILCGGVVLGWLMLTYIPEEQQWQVALSGVMTGAGVGVVVLGIAAQD